MVALRRVDDQIGHGLASRRDLARLLVVKFEHPTFFGGQISEQRLVLVAQGARLVEQLFELRRRERSLVFLLRRGRFRGRETQRNRYDRA